jgi:outer membrane protein assembly factor BamD (BamD/ComL family)
MRTLWVAAVAGALAGCTGSGSGDSSWIAGDRGTGSVPIPSDTRRAGREGIRRVTATPPETEAQVAARRQRSVDAAEGLWNRAAALETSNPGTAAGLYRELAENHPESPRAAEAKFREGRARYRAHQYQEAIDAFQRYMEVAPTNPNLAEVEELVFRSGVEYLATLHGFRAIFNTKEAGYEALQYVAETFPNGAYADDALIALGDAHRTENDKEGWVRSVLAFKLLLLRYPDSPLATRARLGLATTYLTRDQGTRYNGGFTDLDPRESLPSDMEQAALMGRVVSGPELALAEYEAILADGRATPAERAVAERGIVTARERLAQKDLRTANWYAGRSPAAADTYRRSAAEWRDPSPASAPPATPASPLPAAGPPRESPAPATPASPPPPVPPRATPPAPTLGPPPTVPGAGDPTRTAAPRVPGALPPPDSRRLPGATRGSE